MVAVILILSMCAWRWKIFPWRRPRPTTKAATRRPLCRRMQTTTAGNVVLPLRHKLTWSQYTPWLRFRRWRSATEDRQRDHHLLVLGRAIHRRSRCSADITTTKAGAKAARALSRPGLTRSDQASATLPPLRIPYDSNRRPRRAVTSLMCCVSPSPGVTPMMGAMLELSL